MRKKQVARAKQAKVEAEKNMPLPKVEGKVGRFLQRRGTIEINSLEEDTELARKLKAWK